VPTPTLPLPDEPGLDQSRNQARELQRAVRSGAREALAEVASPGPGRSQHTYSMDETALPGTRRHPC